MPTRFLQLRRAFAAALLCAAPCCSELLAAEPAVNADAYSPLLAQPSNGLRIRVAQVAPAQGTAAPNPGAQPGQSTIPSPTSSPTGITPPQGAQPGQSTVPSPSSTPPGSTPAPGVQPGGTFPAQGAPTFQQPAAVVVPRTQAFPQTQVVVPPTQVVTPPQQVVAPPTDGVLPPQSVPAPIGPTDPFLDEPAEELPILDEHQDYQDFNDGCNQRQGVRPYGGGRPDDWYWGCNGSPYRTGPGMCDDWRVGPRWHITVDGMVMSREEADLDAIADEIEANPVGLTPLENPTFEQFDRGPGGRMTFTSQVGRCSGWDIQFAYEGIEAWNSSIVFEKEDFEPEFFTAVITNTTSTITTTTGDNDSSTSGIDSEVRQSTTTTTYVRATDPPLLPVQPGAPFPEGFEQRSLHYRSNYHSGEFNFLRSHNSKWQPYCGVRYINFDDEINDFTNQDAQQPLPFEGPDNVAPGEFLAVATTDRLNLFDIENNLTGFQIGLLQDTWHVNRRFSLEGFVNGGVFYNKIKYTNLMGIFTTQQIADDTSTVGINEARTDFSDTVNNDVREYSEISYVGEASLTGVCRLNKCWALRGGYQALWIANLHLAEDAYLGNENVSQDLFFHGWHAGIECRR